MPYALPKGWKWVRLREVSHDWGQQIPSSRFTYIDVGSIDNKRGTISPNPEVLDSSEAPSRARKIVRRGTVIYSTVRPYLLNAAVIDKDYSPMPIVSTAFAIMHPYAGISGRYIYFYLRSPFFVRYVEANQKGVAYPAINDGDFFVGEFPLPPAAEQERIVAKIDELMARCDVLEKLRAERDAQRLAVHTAAVRQLLNVVDTDGHIQAREFLGQHFGELYTVKENVAELRKAILQLAVMGKLVPQDPNDPPASDLLKQIEAEKKRLVKEGKLKGAKPSAPISDQDVPYGLSKGWVWVRVNDLVEVGTGSTPSTTNRDYYTGSIPWYTSSATNRPIADIPETRISEDAIRDTNCKVFPAGSLIIALYGQGKTRGQISELPIAGATNQAIAAMVFYESSHPIKDYLKHFFVKIYEEIRSIAEGAAQPNLNVGKVKDTLVPLPPLREQKRIVAKIDQLMSLCDILEKQMNAARETQSALLNAVMTQYGGQQCA